ncbi:hypothetical protein M409DRAFT_20880 [Zasmidium cellare ATCC 36951]|uniref:Uncharacterized protein n=1 Tax=Zasmidium cellare ATCC 36951 TaxID=1080233 RepID=A0A6A6CNL2_ZASCE|nr:uncharacterized protein M409DRAFT_20880 [Zasmidium cellare ATCC 36951]KAF2168867.1 hypothetical protein M409DRAFT_20880 [Zasmidium cellare ATCC 36951]
MAWRPGLSVLAVLLKSEVFAASLVNSTSSFSNTTSSVATSSNSTSSTSHGVGAFILQGLGSSQTSTTSESSSSVQSSESTSSSSLSSSVSSTSSASRVSSSPSSDGTSLTSSLHGANTSATAHHASGTIHNLAQITPPPNATTSAGNGTGVLVTQYAPFSYLNGSLTFEPVVWTGNDPNLARAESCWSAITSQQLESSSFYDASVANRTWPITESSTVYNGTYTYTTVIYPTDASTYRLCDGSPRADIKPATQALTTVSSGYPSTFLFNVTATPTTSLSPPCGTPNTGELCYDWFRYGNLTGDYNGHESNDARLLHHECGYPSHFAPNSFNATSWPCLIAGGPVQLYYFPVDTGNQSSCSNRTAISSGSPTTPAPTVVTDGLTLTSGFVYVSFQTLYAQYDGFSYGPGTGYKDLIMTLASSQVSTNCGNGDVRSATAGTQINFADFNYPIPASAYSCAHPCEASCVDATCTPQACSTIWDNFNPVMAIPTPVLDLQEAWKTCSFADENGVNWLFDPPIALTAAANEVKPSLPGGGGSSPASPTPAPGQGQSSQPAESQPSAGEVTVPSPKPTPTSPAAQQTSRPAAPESDNLPSTNGNQQPSPSKNDNPPQSNNAGGSPAPSPSNGGNGQSPSNQNSPTNPNSPGSQNTPAQSSPAPQNSPSNQNSPAPQNSQGSQESPAPQNSPGAQNSPSNQNPPQDTPSTNNQGSPSNQQSNPNGQNSPSNQQNSPAGSNNNNNQPAPSIAQVTAGSNTIQATQLPGNSVVVAGTTLAPGEAATISGVAVSADPSGAGVVVGSQTAAFAPAAAQNNNNEGVFAAGDMTITAANVPGATGAVVVAGKTLSQGGSAAVVNGQMISQGSAGPVVIDGGNTQALNRVGGEGSNVFAAGSVTVTASPGVSNAMVIDGTTLSPGGSAAVINGQTISQGSSGLVAFNGDTTQTLNAISNPNPSVFRAGSLTLTASPATGTDNAMVVDGTTLSPGGSAAVINGQTISADISGGLVAIGASGTSTLSPATSAGDGDAQTLAFGSLTITASAVPGQSGAFVVDGTTLSPGGSGVAVGDGMAVSDASGTLVGVGRSTTAALSTVVGSSSSSSRTTAATTGGSSSGSSSGSAASSTATSAATAAGKVVGHGRSLGAVVLGCICVCMMMI